MATIEIDGKTVEAQNGSMIIQAADQAGIYIPRFCYHKKLSIAANCRMCLVQVGEGKKPMPACATPISDGMKVSTKSEVAVKAQKAVMEFLLINHPLDCPICDQGGQCELQDLSMGYGASQSRYTEGKRSVSNDNLGPLVATEMTRCIHCTRCVRFSREIAGTPELGMTNRGEHSRITNYVEKTLESELSGNMIDVCPVGALTAKPSRFSSRPWELVQRNSIAAHDCLGSPLHVHTRRNQVMKVSPKENEAINEVWLSDCDRFGYQGVNEQRLTEPKIKKQGQWQTVDWETALEFAVEGLQKVLNNHGADQLAALIAPNSTVEEMYALQKLLRGVGSDNIDHRLHRRDFSDQAHDGLTPFKIAELENLDACLLVGSAIQTEQPLAAVRLRKIIKRGGKLLNISAYTGAADQLSFESNFKTLDIAQALAGLAKALGSTAALVATAKIDPAIESMAKFLQKDKKLALILGQEALNHPQASSIKALAQHISELTGAQFILMSDGPNSTGAVLAQAQPKLSSVQEFLAKKLKAYIFFNVDPELDCAQPSQALAAVQAAEFVLGFTPFTDGALVEHADVLLPITPFTETSGTFVNIQGDWQSFTNTVEPLAWARPGWKVLRVLANLLKVEGFDYDSSEEIRNEAHEQSKAQVKPSYQLSNALAQIQSRFVPHYFSARMDNILRHAPALQALPKNQLRLIMNIKTAQDLGLNTSKVLLKQGEQQLELALELSDRVADAAMILPAGFAEVAVFTQPYNLEVRPC